MTEEPAMPQRLDKDSSELDLLFASVDDDPEARAVYEDTMRRATLLASGAALRKERRLSQKDVAAAMGIAQSAISDLESGRKDPQLKMLQRYARAIGCRFDFALVDPELPESEEGASNALEWTLSPLPITSIRQSREQGKNSTTWPQDSWSDQVSRFFRPMNELLMLGMEMAEVAFCGRISENNRNSHTTPLPAVFPTPRPGSALYGSPLWWSRMLPW